VISSTLSDRAAVASDGIKGDAPVVSGLNLIAARLSPGAISESSSSPLPASGTSEDGEAGHVPARLVKSRDDASYGFFSKPPVTVEEVGTGCKWP
jgi:hypothetical protein